MQNFTVADLVQTTLATLAFALFLLPPGYLLGLASNAFGMRRRCAAEQMLFSVAFSIAVTPVLAVLLVRIASYKVTLAVFLLLALISVASIIRQFRIPAGFFSRVQQSTWILLGMMLAWFLVVQFSLADLEIGRRLYVSYATFDHSIRVSFVEAASRSGVPPLNPYYGLGKIPVLRYFYYWYVVCALPMQLLGLGARACFNASVFWSGLGLASTIPLFMKHFLGESEHLPAKSVIGVGLLAVTGLDLIPYGAASFYYHVVPADMEWWDPNQVTSWLGSLLWVPHHVAALTACMAGLLVFSTIDEQIPIGQRTWAVVISVLAFASAAGLSVYVTFAFAVFAVLWALWALSQKQIKTFATYLATAACSLLLSWSYLLDLLSKKVATGLDGTAGRDRFAFFAMRDCPEVLELLGHLGVHNSFLLSLERWAVLPIVYLLEFGFFALILMLRLRRDRRDPGPLTRQRRMAWMMFTICLLTLSFVQSDSSGSNDLGFRGMLVAQFVLLIWSAPIVYNIFVRHDAAAQTGLVTPWIKPALIFTLVMGVAGTLYQLAALRAYAPLADAGKLRRTERFLGAPGFGERTYWMRAGFQRLQALTAPNSLVQYNPVRDEVIMAHLYSTRQAVMGDQSCESAFGGDAEKCSKVFPDFAVVFNDPAVARKWNLDVFCSDFQINVLVATDADPVWQDPDSWVWTRPTLLANPAMRAIPCGTVMNPSVAQ
jgi:hypothetical protein